MALSARCWGWRARSNSGYLSGASSNFAHLQFSFLHSPVSPSCSLHGCPQTQSTSQSDGASKCWQYGPLSQSSESSPSSICVSPSSCSDYLPQITEQYPQKVPECMPFHKLNWPPVSVSHPPPWLDALHKIFVRPRGVWVFFVHDFFPQGNCSNLQSLAQQSRTQSSHPRS